MRPAGHYDGSMEAAIEQLKRSPKLRLVVDELTRALEAEAAARERFREATREDVRAEFVNGEVIEHVTVRNIHAATVARLLMLLRAVAASRGLGIVLAEHALCSFTRNDYLPDIAFWQTARASEFRPHQVLHPAPDLIAEVLSPSTEVLDRGVKFEDYAAHHVREYWILDPDAGTIEQHLLGNGVYLLAFKAKDGTFTSPTLGGFTMSVAAAFEDEANLAALWALAPH